MQCIAKLQIPYIASGKIRKLQRRNDINKLCHCEEPVGPKARRRRGNLVAKCISVNSLATRLLRTSQ